MEEPDGAPPQLDFVQAMNDFKLMFPGMEEDVIEAILRSNSGAVEDTIDQLLTISSDAAAFSQLKREGSETAASTHASSDVSPRNSSAKKAEPRFLSPSAETADNSVLQENQAEYSSNTSTSCSIASSGIDRLLDDREVASNLKLPTFAKHSNISESTVNLLHELDPCAGRTPQQTNKASSDIRTASVDATNSDFELVDLDANNLSHGESATLQRKMSTKSSFTFTNSKNLNCSVKKWNPPMIGKLPKDFLRITNEPNVADILPESAVCRVHGRRARSRQSLLCPHELQYRRQHAATLRTPRVSADPAVHSHACLHTRTCSHPTVPSNSHMNFDLPATNQAIFNHRIPNGTHSSLPRRQSKPSHLNSDLPLPNGSHPDSNQRSPPVTSVDDISQQLNSAFIAERMADNVHRRSSIGSANERHNSKGQDHQNYQLLEDEYLALMLQNSEFLKELQLDSDFMESLKKEQLNFQASSLPQHDTGLPTSANLKSSADSTSSKQQHVDSSSHDANSDFRRQLDQLGGSSRKKLADVAKRFFQRKKKLKPSKLLNKETAVSRINLLEDEYSDDEQSDVVSTTQPLQPTQRQQQQPSPIPELPLVSSNVVPSALPGIRTISHPQESSTPEAPVVTNRPSTIRVQYHPNRELTQYKYVDLL